ncbi:MAG: ABC transporter ATP-binding protein [Acetobacteraceae bacterium]|nr:ABC transporter ATP-binding protein [Acetobacteraceae bacterium]
MTADPLLRIEGLSKRFGGLTVTDEVWLDVLPGEIHAVIGPNGAGKTTLINEVSGVVAPDSGRILFGGLDITRLSMPRRIRAGLARSFQITCVLPGFSVLENVALAAQARDGSSFRFLRPVAKEARLNAAAREALDAVGLADRATMPAGALSHGEKRQLELAIALATRPRLLLLDEPLAGAGPEETERLIALLDRLRSDYAILLVEHDMRAVFALADRISVLVYGRVVATGAPAAIRANPEVRAAYLGEDEA